MYPISCLVCLQWLKEFKSNGWKYFCFLKDECVKAMGGRAYLHHSQKPLQTIMVSLSSVPRSPQAVPREMGPTTGQSQGFGAGALCQVSLEV